MKACIYGAGAIGGWIGHRLARAGASVSVVARGHQHAALRPQPAQSATATKACDPRNPKRTLLYRTVAEHFETWLELASSTARATITGRHRMSRRPFANTWSAASLPTALPWTGSSSAALIWSTAAAKATASRCSQTSTRVNWRKYSVDPWRFQKSLDTLIFYRYCLPHACRLAPS